jgi:hypothetical protein
MRLGYPPNQAGDRLGDEAIDIKDNALQISYNLYERCVTWFTLLDSAIFLNHVIEITILPHAISRRWGGINSLAYFGNLK